MYIYIIYIYIYMMHYVCVCVTFFVFAKLPLAKNANHLGLCSPVGNKRNLSDRCSDKDRNQLSQSLACISHNEFSGCGKLVQKLHPSLDPKTRVGKSLQLRGRHMMDSFSVFIVS